MEKGAPLKAKAKDDRLKGKDDSSTKSKSGRKVQFNFEGSPEAKTNYSPKSGGKDGTPFPKGYSTKGGKGDKTAKGGKSPVFKEPQPLELRIEHELPENVKCVMDCEAADVLQGIQDQMICVIANVCPESVDEFFSLVPSLKTKRSKLSEPLKDVLSELAKLKASANFETQHKEGSQHEGENQNEESEHEDSYLKSSKA
uniref:RNA polymerase Rpb4/RPC9 core domain-containing protein n=1 Tax=Fagus sylvatica TaxID=28930 RepID=A0A2N9EWQ7_FAGSY